MACSAAQLPQHHRPSHSPKPELAGQAHPKRQAVCLEGQERQLVRQEVCLATQAHQLRPRRRRLLRARRYLARLREVRLEVRLAVPSPQGICLAIPRPQRPGPQLPPAHPVSLAISLPRQLLPQPQALRALQPAVSSGPGLLRLLQALLRRRREACLVTPVVHRCSVQLLLPLERPAPRRPQQSRCLEVLARPHRPAHLRPTPPSPPGICLLVGLVGLGLNQRLPQPAPGAFSAKTQHQLLALRNRNRATAPLPAREACSGPSLPKLPLREAHHHYLAALRRAPPQPEPALLRRPHRRVDCLVRRPLPPRQQPLLLLPPNLCSRPPRQRRHPRRHPQQRTPVYLVARRLPLRRLPHRHQRPAVCLAQPLRPLPQRPARLLPRPLTPCLPSRPLPLRRRLLQPPLLPAACSPVLGPLAPRPRRRRMVRPALPPGSRPRP